MRYHFHTSQSLCQPTSIFAVNVDSIFQSWRRLLLYWFRPIFPQNIIMGQGPSEGDAGLLWGFPSEMLWGFSSEVLCGFPSKMLWGFPSEVLSGFSSKVSVRVLVRVLWAFSSEGTVSIFQWGYCEGFPVRVLWGFSSKGTVRVFAVRCCEGFPVRVMWAFSCDGTVWLFLWGADKIINICYNWH